MFPSYDKLGLAERLLRQAAEQMQKTDPAVHRRLAFLADQVNLNRIETTNGRRYTSDTIALATSMLHESKAVDDKVRRFLLLPSHR